MATERAFEDAVHTTLLGSPAPLSSNVGSPYGSAPNLERAVSRTTTMEEKSTKCTYRYRCSASRIENCVQALSQTVAAQTTKTTSTEQIVGSLLARVTTLETGAASGSSGPAQQDLGTNSDIVGSPDDNRNTRRRLDTFSSPEHEHARRAVLCVNNTTLEFPCGSIASGKSPAYQPITNPQGFIAKLVAYPPDSYSRRERNVRTLCGSIQG